MPLTGYSTGQVVSLQSDLAVVKPCDCDVPLCPESILVPSADDTGHDVWVNNLLYIRTGRLLRGLLTETVITAAQMLMLQYFPGRSSLQLPTLQEFCAFQVHTGEFVQIVNIRTGVLCPVLGVTVGLSMCMTACVAQCPIKPSV